VSKLAHALVPKNANNSGASIGEIGGGCQPYGSNKDLLQKYPETAVFLTLAIGFLVERFKFGKFSLGVVTCTLLAGVLI